MLSTGWLSPTGEFVQCGWGDHLDVAEDIVNKSQIYDSAIYWSYDDCLEKNGWIGIHLSLLHNKEWCLSECLHMTPEQHSFLLPYMNDDIQPGVSLRCAMEIYENGY